MPIPQNMPVSRTYSNPWSVMKHLLALNCKLVNTSGVYSLQNTPGNLWTSSCHNLFRWRKLTTISRHFQLWRRHYTISSKHNACCTSTVFQKNHGTATWNDRRFTQMGESKRENVTFKTRNWFNLREAKLFPRTFKYWLAWCNIIEILTWQGNSSKDMTGAASCVPEYFQDSEFHFTHTRVRRRSNFSKR